MLIFLGVYSYGGFDYKVSSPASGSTMNRCREEVLKALKANDTSCSYGKCTFNGIWNNGGGGQKKLFVASFFFDRAAQVSKFYALTVLYKILRIKLICMHICASYVNSSQVM